MDLYGASTIHIQPLLEDIRVLHDKLNSIFSNFSSLMPISLKSLLRHTPNKFYFVQIAIIALDEPENWQNRLSTVLKHQNIGQILFELSAVQLDDIDPDSKIALKKIGDEFLTTLQANSTLLEKIQDYSQQYFPTTCEILDKKIFAYVLILLRGRIPLIHLDGSTLKYLGSGLIFWNHYFELDVPVFITDHKKFFLGYGVIVIHPKVAVSSDIEKPKLIRIISGKASIAIKSDFYGESKSVNKTLIDNCEHRAQNINPPIVPSTKVLHIKPVPNKKHRGGRRKRRLKRNYCAEYVRAKLKLPMQLSGSTATSITPNDGGAFDY